MPKMKNFDGRSILVPVRITQKQDEFLKAFVRRGMFSSRQEAIKYFISEKMLKRQIFQGMEEV